MLWGNNKQEIEDLQKKVNQAIADICLLQQNVELMKTNQTSLRGLVNRKLSEGLPEEKKDELSGKEKYI